MCKDLSPNQFIILSNLYAKNTPPTYYIPVNYLPLHATAAKIIMLKFRSPNLAVLNASRILESPRKSLKLPKTHQIKNSVGTDQVLVLPFKMRFKGQQLQHLGVC